MDTISGYRIEDAFSAAGQLWASAQSIGDDASVTDVEQLAKSLRSIKERQPAPLTTVTLDGAFNVVDVVPCY